MMGDKRRDRSRLVWAKRHQVKKKKSSELHVAAVCCVSVSIRLQGLTLVVTSLAPSLCLISDFFSENDTYEEKCSVPSLTQAANCSSVW